MSEVLWSILKGRATVFHSEIIQCSYPVKRNVVCFVIDTDVDHSPVEDIKTILENGGNLCNFEGRILNLKLGNHRKRKNKRRNFLSIRIKTLYDFKSFDEKLAFIREQGIMAYKKIVDDTIRSDKIVKGMINCSSCKGI